jgi:Cellulase (glycosyl hydrolase family 5)
MINVAQFVVALMAPTVWYGPTTVKFDLATIGNPYDASLNDVRVRFISNGKREERIAYFDGKSWDATLSTSIPGEYRASVVYNGRIAKSLPSTVDVYTKYTMSFVRVALNQVSFLAGDSPYWPLGHDLGWKDSNTPAIPDQLDLMAKAGLNWSRIWACSFDGRNLFWPDSGTMPLGAINLNAAAKWDAITQRAESDNIHFQWVLFHHGEFATKTDPNWPSNPWNTANGGFLAKPEDFFTDPEAFRMAKNVVRYIVARYGHNPSIMAWELFNEVENTDEAHDGNWEQIGKWHREMADYIRSIDPYHHLITTSSDLSKPIWSAMDYYQAHGYPANVGAMIASAKVPGDKPFFFGEVGIGSGNPTPDQERETVLAAIWSALFAGHSGSAEYWYWDRVYELNMYPEFAQMSQIIKELGVVPGPSVKPVSISLQSAQKGDLVLGPGLGWAPSAKLSFNLPQDASGMGQLSSFVQGTGHKDMGSDVTFDFDAPTSGTFMFTVGTVAKSGAELVASLDGTTKLDQKWDSQGRDTPINKQFQFAYSSGHHQIVVQNVGPDWAQVMAYRFSGIGSPCDAFAAKGGDKLLVRVHKNGNGPQTVEFGLADLPLADGTYSLTTWDLSTGSKNSSSATVKDNKPLGQLKLSATDVLYEFQP